MTQDEITKRANILMSDIFKKENKHDVDTEANRIEIHRMLDSLEGTFYEKVWYVSSLSSMLSRTLEEKNLLYRRFLNTLLDGSEKSIKEIETLY